MVRLRRATGLLIFVLIAAPATFFLIHSLKTPVLYAGDRLEERGCRDCGGTGKMEELEMEIPGLGDRCPVCRGVGKVDVIIPGPNRPTRIHGAVADASKTNPFDTYGSIRSGRSPFEPPPPPFQRPEGTIAGARLTFRRGDSEVTEIEANPFGLFNTKLAPGVYAVTVEAPGFAPLETSLEIRVLTAPIWLEQAVVIRPPESWEDAQSHHGLEILAVLARPGQGEGRLTVNPGSPLPY